MKVTKKILPKSEVELTIELTKEEIQSYRQKAIQKISSQVKVDGFRKGHIPEDVIVQKYGENTILSETNELAVKKTYQKALEQENVQIIKAVDIAVVKEEPFTYTAKAPFLPEIKLPELKDIPIPEKKEIKLTKKEIENEKDQICNQMTESKKVEREAKENDLVEIDFEGFDENKQLIPGTVSKHHPIQIGSNAFISGFENELIGLKANEEKNFEITFPKDYQQKDFQNRKVKFFVKVHHVLERLTPELNDELAKKIKGEEATVQSLEKEIEDSLLKNKKNEERMRREEEYLTTLEKLVDIEIPEILIEKEIDSMIESLKERLTNAQVTWENHLKNSKTTEPEIRKQLREQAINRVKKSLAFSKLLVANKPKVSSAQIELEIERIMLSVPKDQKREARKHFTKDQKGWKDIVSKFTVENFFENLFNPQEKEELKV